MSSRKYASGFTLIELLVVIAIIGILASIVLASLSSARAKGRDARRVADLKQLQVAMELYYSSNGHYPIAAAAATAYNVGDGTNGLNAKGLTSSYIASIPNDPSGSTQYYYWAGDTTGSSYCLGAKIEGTTPASTCSTSAWATALNTATGGTYNVGP